MTVLTKAEIESAGLVVGASPEAFQPCGVDLTLESVESFRSKGRITQVDKKLSTYFNVFPLPCTDGTYDLKPGGVYLIRYGEEIHLPDDVMATVYPRSSLMRCGAMLHTAVWDPGYTGKGQGLLVVHNPNGIILQQGARIAQIVFQRLSGATEGYTGSYHGEGLLPGLADVVKTIVAAESSGPESWTGQNIHTRADYEDGLNPWRDQDVNRSLPYQAKPAIGTVQDWVLHYTHQHTFELTPEQQSRLDEMTALCPCTEQTRLRLAMAIYINGLEGR